MRHGSQHRTSSNGTPDIAFGGLQDISPNTRDGDRDMRSYADDANRCHRVVWADPFETQKLAESPSHMVVLSELGLTPWKWFRPMSVGVSLTKMERLEASGRGRRQCIWPVICSLYLRMHKVVTKVKEQSSTPSSELLTVGSNH